MFLLDNSLTNNYFFRMNLSRYNKKYQRDIYFIGLGVQGDIIINPSTQFQYKKKRKSTELNRLLQQKVNKEELDNDRTFSQNVLPTSTLDNDLTLNFIKNIILNNDVKEDSTIEMIIDSVKKFQIKENDNSSVS